jgi:hypothetical protein
LIADQVKFLHLSLSVCAGLETRLSFPERILVILDGSFGFRVTDASTLFVCTHSLDSVTYSIPVLESDTNSQTLLYTSSLLTTSIRTISITTVTTTLTITVTTPDLLGDMDSGFYRYWAVVRLERVYHARSVRCSFMDVMT